MIATLNGIISEKVGDVVVIDVNGVGYGIRVTLEDGGHLPEGRPAKLYIYEHIRENGHDLFGFIDTTTKQLFERLLDVNGVGPRMALSILSVGTTREVIQAIAEGNVKFLQAANGVGKRVAERLVVDLKDKVGLVASDDATTFLSSPRAMGDEAVQALIVLGYTAQDAEYAMNGIDETLSTEERVTLALKSK